jgi:hypothetical protein
VDAGDGAADAAVAGDGGDATTIEAAGDLNAEREDAAAPEHDTGAGEVATSDGARDVAKSADGDAGASEVAAQADARADAAEVSSHVAPPTYLGTFALPMTGDWSAVAIASDGSYFFAGSFRHATDFDPGPADDIRVPQGTSDAFVTKLNADGSYAWTMTFGGPGAQAGIFAMAVSDGAIVLAGNYTGEVDFDPGAGVQDGPVGAADDGVGFVLSLTHAGAFSWMSPLQGCGVYSVALDADGSVYVGGAFDDICDFDPGPGVDQRGGAVGQNNGFLVKLAHDDGHELWADTLSGAACAAFVQAISMSADGNVWATGDVGSGCTFGGVAAPPSSSEDSATLIASVTPGGAVDGLWSIDAGTGQSIAGASDGSIYLGGFVSGVSAVDFDPGPGVVSHTIPPDGANPDDSDLTGYVLKLGADGKFGWVQTTARVSIVGLAADDDGGVIALGQPVPDVNRTIAIVMTKLSADMSTQWSLSFPGTDAAALSIAAGTSTFAIVGGTVGSFNVAPAPAVEDLTTNTSFLSRYSF